MNKLNYLSKEEFSQIVKDLEGDHWVQEETAMRWDYHNRVIEIIKGISLKDSNEVLEMGTMGASCIKNSNTLDYTERWSFKGKNPTYIHDGRNIPWPIKEKQYEVFIALRVFQHLVPVQNTAVKEAFRIANKVILMVPERYNNPILPESKGLSYSEFVSILEGIHPNIYIKTNFGSLFYWDTENSSYINLKEVLKSQPKNKEQINKPKTLKVRLKNKLKKLLK